MNVICPIARKRVEGGEEEREGGGREGMREGWREGEGKRREGDIG